MHRRTLISSAVLLAPTLASICDQNQADDAVRIARVYSVGDLPVWSEDGNAFQPVILLALLKESLGPENWKWKDDKREALVSVDSRSSVTAVEVNRGLVVNASQTCHSQIARLLEQLPRTK